MQLLLGLFHFKWEHNDLQFCESTVEKNKIIDGIKEASEKQEEETPSPSYSAEETEVRLYGRTAIVAFKLVATWVEDGEEMQQLYFNTGTFLKRKGVWQAVAWQATKIPEPAPPP